MEVHDAGIVHMPRRLLIETVLKHIANFPGHHLGIDGVRDARRLAGVD